MRSSEDTVGGGYFKHAVYNHWDSYEDVSQELLEQDRERSIAMEDDREEFLDVAQYLAPFGAGEESPSRTVPRPTDSDCCDRCRYDRTTEYGRTGTQVQ